MRIILSQYRPVIRLWKWAVTLQKMGHNVEVLYTKECSPFLPWDKFNLLKYTPKELPEVDLHITFNTNVRPLSFLYPKQTIQAVGDLKGFYDEYKYLEKRSLFDSRACVFVSDVQREQAEEMYPFIKDKSYTIYNGIVARMNKIKPKNKIGGKNINVVYSGCLTDSSRHRNICDELNYISNLKGISLYVYYAPQTGCPECIRNNPNIIVKDPVSPLRLISEMAQYDVGLIKVNMDSIGGERIADSMLPNKLSEYLEANIPVICPRYRQLECFNDGKNCLFFIGDEGNVEKAIKDAYSSKNNVIKYAKNLRYSKQLKKINQIINLP